ncbi:hypothetical protein [Flavobacterium reichenbachii]|uniref:hypothetical protein n=1 Tax=Flavobacterium reichenbachii TaxID=362418 RepID=UPI000ACEC92B|nr:hypothetical protein [Flavobacterium reichenbachii]
MLEYFFIIQKFDFSTVIVIAPNDDVYNDTIELLKAKEDVSSYIVIKGKQVFSSESDLRIQNLRL